MDEKLSKRKAHKLYIDAVSQHEHEQESKSIICNLTQNGFAE